MGHKKLLPGNSVIRVIFWKIKWTFTEMILLFIGQEQFHIVKSIINENKLYTLKPNFNSKCSFLNLNRHDQTKITRCRIGHTRLTHSYLLNNKQPSFCVSCHEPFTLKQFLISCIDFHHIHRKYFNAKTAKELFNVSSVDKIISFLKKKSIFLANCNLYFLFSRVISIIFMVISVFYLVSNKFIM